MAGGVVTGQFLVPHLKDLFAAGPRQIDVYRLILVPYQEAAVTS